MIESALRVKPQEAGGTTPLTDKTQIIGDDLQVYINISLNIIIPAIISSLGVITNFLNMAVFLKLGLKDSMSVGLFALSLTDLLVTSVQLAISLCYLVDLLYPNNSFDIWHLGFSDFGWVFNICYEVSCWITAMMSVERCFCVVSPFKVKQLFTRFRCVTFILTIYLINIAIHIPIYVTDTYQRTKSVPLLINNTSIDTPLLVVTQLLDQELLLLETILDLTASIGLGLLCQTVVIVSAVWMGYSLESSSKCRTQPSIFNPRLSSQRQQSSWSKQGPTRLSNRERRLVKVVLSLAVTLTAFNIPKVIVVIMYYSDTEMSSLHQNNLSTTIWSVASSSITLNCSINFLWYMRLNASYRKTFHRLWKTK